VLLVTRRQRCYLEVDRPRRIVISWGRDGPVGFFLPTPARSRCSWSPTERGRRSESSTMACPRPRRPAMPRA